MNNFDDGKCLCSVKFCFKISWNEVGFYIFYAQGNKWCGDSNAVTSTPRQVLHKRLECSRSMKPMPVSNCSSAYKVDRFVAIA